MNISPEDYAEICKQSAFISALVAGFSFAYLGALLVSSVRNKIIDTVMGFSIVSIAGLLICSLAWTLSASRMAYYKSTNILNVPDMIISLHKRLSLIFILSFFFFLVSLGLSGWIRSRRLGIFSSLISFIALIFFFMLMRQFRI